MKKTISIILAICIAVSAVVTTSVLVFGRKIVKTGTEAAKLLLANSRLDADLVNKKVDFGMANNKKKNNAIMLDNLLSAASTLDMSFSSGIEDFARNIENLDGEVVVSNEAKEIPYTWDTFPKESMSVIEFYQFIDTVESEVERLAKDIVKMKTKVGITDKWVKFANGNMQMLRVYENRDVLITKDKFGYSVNYRYTDENAVSVYESYTFNSYNDGTTGKIRTMFIPGQRYEFMYENSNGFNDYFIADNSRGYWVNTRFDYIDEDGYKRARFSPNIIKDGLGYSLYMETSSDSQVLTNAYYTVYDPVSDCELFRVDEGEDYHEFTLYLCAIDEGFKSVHASETYVDGKIYQTSSQIDNFKTATTSLDKIPYDAITDQFSLTGGMVQYLYAEKKYYGNAEFTKRKNGETIYDACGTFGEFAKEIGLTIHCDMQTVANSIYHASLLSEIFGETFVWNGYEITGIVNAENAWKVMQEQFDSAKSYYEEVKDFEIAEGRQTLDNSVDFASLSVNVGGQNSYLNEIIQVEEVTLSISDTTLFEIGEEYVAKVGLAMLDDSGNASAVNLVQLAGGESSSVRFNGESVTLSLNGRYSAPKNLEQGEYAVVVYVTTKDGIRVSELKKLNFTLIEEGTIPSEAMYMESASADGQLLFKYAIKNERVVTITASKENYSYAEVKRMLMIEILKVGAPYSDAVLEDGDGKLIEEGATLKKGVYRILCYLMTSDGLAQSYIYLTIE